MSNDLVEKVFEAIKEERDYQEKLWGPTPSGGEHSVTEYVLYIEDYIQEIRHTLSRKAEAVAVPEALHGLRKVATMCVKAMEQNGIERRDMSDLDKSCELHSVKCKDE